MSEESAKKSTKKHRKSEQEPGKGSKARTSGIAENSHDLGESLQPCSSLSIARLGSTTIDSTLTRKDGDRPSSTPPDALGKAKVSRKRKRMDRGAILDGSVDSKTDGTELKFPKVKKRDEGVHCQPYPDPAIDESLSEQSRRALSYAYRRCREIDAWKFNKARQNWLLRNVWSEQAVPENYIPLVIGYLAGIRGGAREKLIEECISKSSTSKGPPIQGMRPSDDSNKDGFTGQQADTSRALSILHILRNDS